MKKMTMIQLRDHTVKNGLYYYHVYGTKDRVLIYGDRYHRRLIEKVIVPDYRPIKNFKSMGYGENHTVLILKTIKNRLASYKVTIGEIKITVAPRTQEESDIIERWLKNE